MTDERPVVVIHLYPEGVPNVVETPIGFPPEESLRLADQLDRGVLTTIVSSDYDVQFCRHTDDGQGIMRGTLEGFPHG